MDLCLLGICEDMYASEYGCSCFMFACVCAHMHVYMSRWMLPWVYALCSPGHTWASV